MIVTLETFVLVITFASAALAFWLAIVHPSLMPRTGGWIVAHAGLAFVLLSLEPPVVGWVTRNAGVQPALLGVVLPSLTYLFLAAAWVLVYLHGAVGRRGY